MRVGRPRLIAAGLVAVGASMATLAGQRQPLDSPMSNPYAEKGRERADAIRNLVAEQADMDWRAKVERAYDGAVRTHEIGFPASRPR